uniref:Uncharacterized protein n=1 Tax=Arundo donax TaxID=35708 RepID=A0A0A9DNL3_ARUDO
MLLPLILFSPPARKDISKLQVGLLYRLVLSLC